MTFYDLIGYTDVLVCRKFEGLESGSGELGMSFSNFTDQQVRDVEEVNKWAQLGKLSEEARQAWMTKMLAGPMLNVELVMQNFT